jgi:hypothetical protein
MCLIGHHHNFTVEETENINIYINTHILKCWSTESSKFAIDIHGSGKLKKICRKTSVFLTQLTP